MSLQFYYVSVCGWNGKIAPQKPELTLFHGASYGNKALPSLRWNWTRHLWMPVSPGKSATYQ